MRLTALLALLTLVALAFAGCSGGKDDGGEGTTSSSTSSSRSTSASGSVSVSVSASATSTTSSSSSSSTGPAANVAPTGSISASVNGTNVTFTLAGTDPDGDALTWELDFGDGSGNADGSALPANETHTYAVGNYTANFTVTDGKDPKTYDLDVSIVANGPASPTVLTGEVTVPGTPLTSDALGANGCAGFNAGMSGQDCVFFTLEPAFAGKHYLAEGTGTNLDLEIWGTCDRAPPSKLDGGSLDSTIPAGAGCMILWFYSAGSTGTVTVTIG